MTGASPVTTIYVVPLRGKLRSSCIVVTGLAPVMSVAPTTNTAYIVFAWNAVNVPLPPCVSTRIPT